MAKHKTGDVIAMMATIQKYWVTASGEPELKDFATYMLDLMDARVGEAAMSKALNNSGLEFTVGTDGEMQISPSFLRLDNIKVELVKRGRYIADPAWRGFCCQIHLLQLVQRLHEKRIYICSGNPFHPDG